MSLTIDVKMDKNFLTKDISSLVCFYKPDDRHGSQHKINEYLKDILDEISYSLTSTSYKTLVLTIVWETGDPVYWKDCFQQFLTQLKQQYYKLEIIIIFESWFEPFQLKFTSVDEVYYIDFWIYKVYESLIIQKTSEPVLDWDSTSQNILFMTGKSNKIHRTRLLYKLLNSEIKNYLSWSYKVDQQNVNESLAFLKDLSTDQQNKFLNLAQRDLDGHLGTLTGLRGTQFDPIIYKNSVFQIISETEFDRPLSQPFITEKTWISIVNHRPFIVASELGHLSQLNKRGIRTFNQYLSIPNYDNPELSNFLDYSSSSCNSGRFSCVQEFNNWKSFYQNFKDASWVDIESKDDINTLPDHIQHELQTAYQPGYYSFGEIRLDAIVENAVFFKKNIISHVAQINDDVKYNFQVFLELAKNAQVKLEDLHVKHRLVCKNLYDVFEVFI